jgi:hypothetical protein
MEPNPCHIVGGANGSTRFVPELHLEYLSDKERLMYANLKHIKDTVQPQLGITVTDVSKISRIVHKLRQLETIAVLRLEIDTFSPEEDFPLVAKDH